MNQFDFARAFFGSPVKALLGWVAFAGLLVLTIDPCIGQSPDSMRSLRLVPIDADFYSGSFQMLEQWQRFANGPVVKETLGLPVVERLVSQLQTDWKNRAGIGANARMVLENGNVQDALAFLKEMVSKDMFVFGDKHCAKWLEVGGKLNEQMAAAINNADDPGSAGKVILEMWSKALADLPLPTLVMGARCDNEDVALSKIDLLEFGIQQIPNFAAISNNFKRLDDQRGNRLQLVLHGSMIPWDSIPTGDNLDEDSLQSLRKVLQDKSVTITLGLFDKNMIFAVSPNPNAMKELGSGKSLWEHSDMQPVRDAADQTVIAVSYVSDAFAMANYNASYKDFFSKLMRNNQSQLDAMTEGKPEFKSFFKKVLGDLQSIDETIKKMVPELKGTTSITHLTNDGWERNDYFRTKDMVGDGTMRLPSLEHVGEAPLFLIASRMQQHPEYFRYFRSMMDTLKTRFDEAKKLDWSEINDEFDADQMDEISDWVDDFWPLLTRAADIWETKFLPAMSGEHGIVLHGGNLRAKQWCKEMPLSSEPLPFPELATVTGMKDAGLLKDGFEKTFDLVDDVLNKVRKRVPGQIPDWIKVPRPTRLETSQGEKYGIEIPKECPVPKEMSPHGWFVGNYLFCAYSDKQTAALATTNKVSFGQGVIDAQAKQKSVAYVHLGRLFEFARPWVRYAIIESFESLDENVFEDMLEEEYAEYDITGKELITLWSIPAKLGEISSVTTSMANGGSHIRSVYKSQSSK